MKRLFIGTLIFIIFLGFDISNGDQNIFCTQEYLPVCAQIKIECIKQPCPTIKQTFGNRCEMSLNKNAKFLYDGECEDQKNTLDLTNCETYFDGCNTCGVLDGKLEFCTEIYCELPLQQAKCIQFKSVGISNPAAVYCQKNGGISKIQSNEKGEYGICVFDDEYSCEEWAFYRGECKNPSSVEKYLVGYMTKNSDLFPDNKTKIDFLKKLQTKFLNIYRNIYHNIQELIENLYQNDYEKKKITLMADGNYHSFILQIPKSWKNKYSEKVVRDNKSSSFIFEYKSKTFGNNMIFSITMTSVGNWNDIIKDGYFNTEKIIEIDGYVFFYSRALDMPYTGKEFEEYGDMVGSVEDIIQTLNLMK